MSSKTHSKDAARSGLALLLIATAPSWLATQASGADNLTIYSDNGDRGYFVRASGKALFNVGVSVETVRPAYGTGEYGNGYVLPDIGGSTSLTWNWGYQSASQVDSASDQLTFERYKNLPPLGTQKETAIAPGGEVMAGMEMGTFKLGKRTVRFGVEAGYAFNRLSVNLGASGSSMVTYATAAYDLSGVVPPGAPYSGTPEGPGPLISVTPASTDSTVVSSAASYSGTFEGSLHSFKFGAWFDYPISDSLFTSLSFGYASIYADAQFQFTETLTYPAETTSHTVGSENDWKPGFYAQWRMGYRVTKRLSAFLGADYQWNNKSVFSEAGRNVTLDFSALFSASAGLQYNF